MNLFLTSLQFISSDDNCLRFKTNNAVFSYGGYGDLAARRKNATRESTATLKAWLNEHKKNPYPTKGEKIMLAIITKMTLTQVMMKFMMNLKTEPLLSLMLFEHEQKSRVS